jgi:hypothetical protein
MRSPGRWLFALPVVLYLLGTTFFLQMAGPFHSFPLDDAWIHQVYARSVASGHGFEYNSGTQEAGATSPLWVILTAPVHWFDGGNAKIVVAGVMLIGALFAIAALLLFASIVQRVTHSALVASVAASLLALDPRLLFSALSGMETMLVVMLWLAAVSALLARRWWLAAAAFALMPVARPECLVVLPLGALMLLVSNRDRSWPRRVAPVIVLGIPFALWAFFCDRINGHWLPNTYYVKVHAVSLSAAVVANAWDIVSGQGLATVFLFPIGLLIATVELSRRRRWVELVMMLGAPLVYAVAVAGTRPLFNEGYYWTRWLDPPALLLSAACALGVAILLTGSVAGIRERRAWRTVAVSAGVIALAVCVPRLAQSWKERRDRLRTDSSVIDRMNVSAGRWIRDHTPEDATVAVEDAGAIRYFGNRRTVDLAGINDQAVAFGRMSRIDALLKCDWLVIFPMHLQAQRDLLRNQYDVAEVIHVKPEEYTICHDIGQTTIGIYHKKGAP